MPDIRLRPGTVNPTDVALTRGEVPLTDITLSPSPTFPALARVALTLEPGDFAGIGAATQGTSTGSGAGSERFIATGAGSSATSAGSGIALVRFASSGSGAGGASASLGSGLLRFIGSGEALSALSTSTGTGTFSEAADGRSADGGGFPFLDVPVTIIPNVRGRGAALGARSTGLGYGRCRDAEITELWLLGALTDDEWIAEMAA